MIGPDGTEYPSHGVFREVHTGRRIVTSDEFGEGMEQVVPDLPQGIIVTTLFEDQEGGTKVTVRMAHPTEEDRRRHEAMGVIPGWQSTFDCLEEHLATVQG
jgi:uncharacterized protein YndB with AHSA1/START domain